MPEARLEDSGSGLAPASDGWFVVNARDAEWWTSKSFGAGSVFESREFAFPEFGINLSVLEPGEPNCLYHSENQQEAFLVLSGECRLLVDGEERLLRSWDFFHCPAGTEHVFVGAGDGPCVILAAGARSENEQLLYPASELPARYGASAEETTPDPKEAYARFERSERGRPAYWDRLPWSRAAGSA
ncbi:MAG: cupin domain-containing protein [Actinomycetota bacterium]|nr:cupin domain-containing protein [Actinomycetota bacterium]